MLFEVSEHLSDGCNLANFGCERPDITKAEENEKQSDILT